MDLYRVSELGKYRLRPS